MLSKLLSVLYRLAIAHRRRVYVALSILVPLAGVAAASQLRISTSQKALLPADHPVQQDYRTFVEEFGAVDALIAVVHGDDPESLKPVADALADEIRAQRRWVRNVFYKVDLNLIADHAPYFVPVDELRRLRRELTAHAERLCAIDDMGPLDGVLAALDDLLGADEGGGGMSAAPIDAQYLPAAIGGLTRLFTEWQAFLDDPARPLPDPIEAAMRSAQADNPMARAGGYLASRDGRMLFLFVQPIDSSDESAFLKPFLAAMRRTADQVLSAHPEAQGKVRIGFTGMPAHVQTEAETVFSDVAHGLAGAVVLIIAIIFVGFRTLRKTACILLPLICGMLLSLGAIALIIGRLNLISAAFFAVMFGMSIDFSIYLIRRAEEALGEGLAIEEAVRIAVTKTGRGVLVGGLTTCAAFFGTSFTDFSGFSELGLAAGIGIFICLTCVFCLTPALMLSLGLEPRQADLQAIEREFGSAKGRRKLWATAIAFALVGLASLTQVFSIRFDYDALKLLPRGSESTLLQIRMQDESDLSANSAAVIADSIEEVRRITAELAKHPEVSHIESIADLIPERQTEKAAELAKIRALLTANSQRLRRAIEGSAGPIEAARADERDGHADALVRRDRFLARLDGLAEKIERAQESAFAGGLTRIVAPLDEALAAVTALRGEFGRRSPGDAIAATDAFERALGQAIDRAIEQVALWATATPMSEQKLAPELLARFKSDRGRFVAYVFPTSIVWDVSALDRFMDAIRAVTPQVTGFAATHQVFSRLVVSGFYESMAFAFLALLLMLFIDLRRPRAVLFAVMPIALGFALIQGVLRLIGIDYNYASVAAYPVLLGYGSDYGVNIVHRWLERPKVTAFVPAMTVGKGVLLSAATSIAGLLSIVFARHKGVSDFGAVLLVGICACFVTAVIALPTLIDLVTHPKGVQDDPASPPSSADAPQPAEDPAAAASHRASV